MALSVSGQPLRRREFTEPSLICADAQNFGKGEEFLNCLADALVKHPYEIQMTVIRLMDAGDLFKARKCPA